MARMNRYDVKSGASYIEVIAEDVKWSANGLEFITNHEVTALFLQWDYWIKTGVKDETEPT